MRDVLQRLITAIYPPQCVMCDARTEVDFALCGSCWAETPFISGLCCDACGCPLPGQGSPSPDVLCDDCMQIARPWRAGRAVFVYKDKGRRFVLSLKHGDRHELARAGGAWLARAAQPFLAEDSLIVPVPLHRFRLLRRTFNQAALLADEMARVAGVEHIPDALERPKPTKPLDGRTRDERFAALGDAITANPRYLGALTGRKVILVDDVMTSGATLAASAEACFAAGADDVCVVALARVVKDA